ncbi:MAG: hypothetical protein ACK5WD_02650 [bacterium]|jgi:hypothetical protein
MSNTLSFIVGALLIAAGAFVLTGLWIEVRYKLLLGRNPRIPIPFGGILLSLGLLILVSACDRSGLAWTPGAYKALVDREVLGIPVEFVILCGLFTFTDPVGYLLLGIPLHRFFRWRRRVAIRRRRAARLRARAGPRGLT